ncbi:hypothetical protein TNCV_388771 [Trichonephila clavipes]|nr:hypothetical protein TNCV_388771 [Trichonephila clavipes]
MISYNSFSNPISLTLKAVYRKANSLSHCQAPAYLIINVTIQKNQRIPRVSPQSHAPTYRQQSSLSVTHISNLRHFRHERIVRETQNWISLSAGASRWNGHESLLEFIPKQMRSFLLSAFQFYPRFLPNLSRTCDRRVAGSNPGMSEDSPCGRADAR